MGKIANVAASPCYFSGWTRAWLPVEIVEPARHARRACQWRRRRLGFEEAHLAVRSMNDRTWLIAQRDGCALWQLVRILALPVYLSFQEEEPGPEWLAPASPPRTAEFKQVHACLYSRSAASAERRKTLSSSSSWSSSSSISKGDKAARLMPGKTVEMATSKL